MTTQEKKKFFELKRIEENEKQKKILENLNDFEHLNGLIVESLEMSGDGETQKDLFIDFLNDDRDNLPAEVFTALLDNWILPEARGLLDSMRETVKFYFNTDERDRGRELDDTAEELEKFIQANE